MNRRPLVAWTSHQRITSQSTGDSRGALSVEWSSVVGAGMVHGESAKEDES